MTGRDPAFAASPSSPCGSRPSGLQSGVGFTPGPWRVGRLGTEKQEHVVDMGNPPKAPFAVVHSDGPREEVEANARLIAAAPELYEALERLVEDVANKWGDPHTFEEAILALAKASGADA